MKTPSPLSVLTSFAQKTNVFLDLGLDSKIPTTAPQQQQQQPWEHHDTIKRSKLEHAQHPSIFTLALTVDSEEYSSIEAINIQDLYKSSLENRPASSGSANSTSSILSKKRAFSDVLVDPPKFRMSRKKPRQHPPDQDIPQDYVVFDAVREPLAEKSNQDMVPEILESGIPDQIQSGNPAMDAALNEMLQSYLTVDADNRTYVKFKDEYVYDIYYRTAVSPATVPTDANFGVLVYESEPELMDDEEEVVDDEDADSNSEGYYQNSYPDEDEWAGEGWGSDEEQDEYGRRRTRKFGFDSDEDIGSESGDDVHSYSETEL